MTSTLAVTQISLLNHHPLFCESDCQVCTEYSIPGQLQSKLSFRYNAKSFTKELRTALLARALDQFLFPDNILEKGACLHQLPVTHSAERPNFYTLKFNEAIPHKPIGVSDFKKDSLEKAHRESFAYATRLIENSDQEEKFAVRLVFLFTQHQISLQLHVAFMGYMMVIKIVEVDIWRDLLKVFFRL